MMLNFAKQFFSSKHQAALTLLSTINDLGSVDPTVALVLLCLCSSFCKLAHIARATPPHLILGSMEKFDADVHHSLLIILVLMSLTQLGGRPS